jgi:YD repeat-containing protein
MQLTGRTNALAQVTTFGYDLLGNLTNVTDARSNPLAFGYDAVSRDSSQRFYRVGLIP